MMYLSFLPLTILQVVLKVLHSVLQRLQLQPQVPVRVINVFYRSSLSVAGQFLASVFAKNLQ